MTSPDRRAPGKPTRRFGALLVLLPLVLGLLYYVAAGPLLEGNPTLRDMVPEKAIEVQRYRNLAAYDSMHVPPERTGQVAPKASAILGTEMNLPGLPGIDPSRPLLVTTLPPSGRASPEVHVLPVADRKRVEETFRRPDLEERHARHLRVHGSWAALGWDLDAVRRAGRGGGLWAEDRGEDWVRVADWPGVVDFALAHGDEAPFLQILGALGYDASKVTVLASGEKQVAYGRVPVVRDAWKTVTLYGWSDRIRAELVPSDGTALASALAVAKAAGSDARAAARLPFEAEASLSCLGANGRRVVALALRDAGVSFPEGVKAESLRLDPPGSMLLFATLAPGALPTWSVGIAAPPAAIPDLSAFGLPDPPAGQSLPLPAGATSLTAPYGAGAGAGTIARASIARLGLDVVTFGVDGETAAPKMASLLEAPGAEELVKEAGTVRLARFHLGAVPAARLLGRALSPGAILSPLAGGAIDGTLSTDGTRLILEASRSR